MKSRWSRVIAILLVLTLIAAACGDDDDDTSASDGDGTASDDGAGDGSSDDSAAPSDGEDPVEYSQGASDDTIKIGSSLPITGPAAGTGTAMREALEAFVSNLNAQGGVNGRSVEISIYDDGLEPARVQANFRRLGDQDNVFSVISPAGSAQIPSAYPFIEESGLPLFGPVLPPDPDMQQVYIIGTGRSDQARVMSDFLLEQGAVTVGLIGQNNDLGQSMLAGLEEQLPKNGQELVITELSLDAETNEVEGALNNVRDANPDAVVMATNQVQAALILREATSQGWEPIFIGDTSSASTGAMDTVEPAGDAAVGLYGTTNRSFTTLDSDAVADYRAVMEEYAPGSVDDGFALYAYAIADVFFEVIERMGDDLTWENFHATAEAMSGYENGLLPAVTFGPLPGGHSGNTGAAVAMWDGTDWVIVREFTDPS
ncbi:MAG: ABC transporter substrate-binding protein [Acidimicrobiales bacterium]